MTTLQSGRCTRGSIVSCIRGQETSCHWTGDSGINHSKGSDFDDNKDKCDDESEGNEGNGDKGDDQNFPEGPRREEGDDGSPPAARLHPNQLLRRQQWQGQ